MRTRREAEAVGGSFVFAGALAAGIMREQPAWEAEHAGQYEDNETLPANISATTGTTSNGRQSKASDPIDVCHGRSAVNTHLMTPTIPQHGRPIMTSQVIASTFTLHSTLTSGHAATAWLIF